jgi:3-dehydroshikimate dehydratase
VTRLGLCSVTFRALTPREVTETAAAAGLQTVEWGADVHAPPDQPTALRRVRGLTAEAGLTTCSYGSYWRAGAHTTEDFARVAEAAVELGAPRIRVWAGTEGSAAATPATRARVTAALREAAELAATRGLEIACEFHAGTLTDTPRATLGLLADVDHPRLSTYWQPPVDTPADTALAGLAELLDNAHVSAVHVFSWLPGQTRLPLAAREPLWRGACDLAAARPVDLLLEFVPGDSPAVLAREAATLRSWLEDAST